MPLVVPVQGAQSIQMHTNASEPAPGPFVSAMEMVVVVIPAVQMPIRPHVTPVPAIPALQDAQTIQVTSNSAVPTPEPSRPLVIMVSAPQMPIGSDSSPVSLVISIQGAQSVEVHSDASEPSPSPTRAPMQTVIVVVPTVEVPVCSYIVPS
jgi:hypothetical protein